MAGPIDEIMADIGRQVKGIMETLGPEMVEDVREYIGEPYPPASAPGQPPHKRSGELAASVSYRVVELGPNVYTLELEVAAEHAVYLEEGTATMAPRPFKGPMEQKWEGIVAQRVSLGLQNSNL